MSYEQALAIVPYVYFGAGLVCFLVGYWAGSTRTYASLGYGSESLRQIFGTMRLGYGSIRYRLFRR